jgi:hypothetical protein
LAKYFSQRVCIGALFALSFSLSQACLCYAGSRNVGNVGDACAGDINCQAEGGEYCDKDERVCKESPRFQNVPGNPVTFQARGCQKAADCSPGWECVGYLCIVNARGCHSDVDCLPHQVCVPENPESPSHGACQPEDVAKKLLDKQK